MRMAPALQTAESDTDGGDMAKAPAEYNVRFETSKGAFIVNVDRSWSPHGADHFYRLVKSGFYNGCRFFRVLDGFMAQVGINGDPKVQAKWRDRSISDDPVVKSNTRGYLSYAKPGSGTDNRTTQFFINYDDNSNLDDMGFAPFGYVTEGMEVVDSLYSGYGEGAPNGQGPDQERMQYEGNEYLEKSFPRLDYIEKATIVETGE